MRALSPTASWLASRVRETRGVALVEFALVAPLLFLVLFGVLDFGKAFNHWIDETQLASEGARLAAVNSAKTASCSGGNSLQCYIKQQADTSQLQGDAQVCISFPAGTSNPGDPVRVTVTEQYVWLPLIGNALGATSVTLNGAATMRLETTSGQTFNYSAGCTT
jgi:hypothetical protein